MLDHTGKERERYEDAFRAVGNYLDAEQFTDLTIVETPDGFVIKGYRYDPSAAAAAVSVPESYFFANEDIDDLLEHAYARRGHGPEPRAKLRRL